MRLLAIEAGGPVLSAALFEKGLPIGQACLRAPRRQTEELAPLVHGLLGRSGWKPSSLEALACGRGPGSFTGLRSSLAFGKGFGLALPGLKLVALSTLSAWAEAFCPPDKDEALVLLDGRRSQVYRGHLRRIPAAAGGGSEWRETLPSALMDLDAALREGAASPRAFLLGDLDPAPAGLQVPQLDSAALALAVGRLALTVLASQNPLPDWEPAYLRRSEAELLWERLHPEAAVPGPSKTAA